MPGNEDNEALRVEAADFLENVQPGTVAKPDVEQDHVRRLFGGQPQSRLAVFSAQHLDSLAFEDVFDAEDNAGLVVNHQNLGHRRPPDRFRKMAIRP